MRQFVGDSVLVSPVWNWGVYYTDTVKQAMNGSWTTHSYWGGLKEGVVTLSDFSPKVPMDVQDMVNEARQHIINGDWDVFTGPIYDQSGKMIVAEGETISDGDMLGMSYFVKGVVGNTGN